MVAKKNLVDARDELRDALKPFVEQTGAAFVEPNEVGHLVVVVVSDRFKGLNFMKRFDVVWKYLRAKVSWDTLAYLSRIETMDLDEYRSRFGRSDFSGVNLAATRVDNE